VKNKRNLKMVLWNLFDIWLFLIVISIFGTMKFTFKHFSELSIDELYGILQLRAEIFVVEQDCVYNDIDGLDKDAVHQFLKKGNKIVAYSRLLKPGTRFPDYSIGRVVVNQSERGTGLGIQMMEEAKAYILENMGATKIKISAQKYLRKFYENLGFVVITDEYLEDGIPHFGMLYTN
jgi:ElaA protein